MLAHKDSHEACCEMIQLWSSLSKSDPVKAVDPEIQSPNVWPAEATLMQVARRSFKETLRGGEFSEVTLHIQEHWDVQQMALWG